MPLREILIGIALVCSLTALSLSAVDVAKNLGLDRGPTRSVLLAVWLIACQLLYGVQP